MSPTICMSIIEIKIVEWETVKKYSSARIILLNVTNATIELEIRWVYKTEWNVYYKVKLLLDIDYDFVCKLMRENVINLRGLK